MNGISVVLGAGGFIGGHLVRRLVDSGRKVRAVDIKPMDEWYQRNVEADRFDECDLRKHGRCERALAGASEVYQLAADMGGAGYIFTGEHDASVMHNSAQINLNVAELARTGKFRLFYSSSACIYPARNQTNPDAPDCAEHTAYPADPDSEYGWEKLFSERLYLAYARNYGIDVRIARFHNIFGPFGTWDGGREKAPAAICRKVLEAIDGDGTIEIWGDGEQTRSFCWIGDCLDGIERMMNSDVTEPINLGSSEMVSINQLVSLVESIAGVKLNRRYELVAPTGVRGRNSDNTKINSLLGWEPSTPLAVGLAETYRWIKEQYEARKAGKAVVQ
jgi:GDP-D-mannose 3',5'-epimerase